MFRNELLNFTYIWTSNICLNFKADRTLYYTFLFYFFYGNKILLPLQKLIRVHWKRIENKAIITKASVLLLWIIHNWTRWFQYVKNTYVLSVTLRTNFMTSYQEWNKSVDVWGRILLQLMDDNCNIPDLVLVFFMVKLWIIPGLELAKPFTCMIIAENSTILTTMCEQNIQT